MVESIGLFNEKTDAKIATVDGKLSNLSSAVQTLQSAGDDFRGQIVDMNTAVKTPKQDIGIIKSNMEEERRRQKPLE